MVGRYVTVRVVPGALRQVWCDQCHTSAGVEVDLYTFVGAGGPYHLGTLTYCTDCDDASDAAQTAVAEIQKAVNDAHNR